MKVWADEVGINVRRSQPARVSYPGRKVGITGRVFNVVAALYCTALAVIDLLGGRMVLAAILLVLVVASVASFAVSTKGAARSRARAVEQSRPRPDYRLIAALERDIYGEAFHHDGAPSIASAPCERRSALDLYPPVQHFGICPAHTDRARHYLRQQEGLGAARAAERKAFKAASVSASETFATLDRLMNETLAHKSRKL
jgi:hypothetical protein